MLTAFGILGKQPISFLSEEELTSWDDKELNVLLDHFGKELSHGESKSQPLVEPAATRLEWAQVKPLVLKSLYPRDKLSVLWSLIHKYHSDLFPGFPNLIKLASVALVLPTNTADCERGFGAKNSVKLANRNRLSPARVNSLLLLMTEGPVIEEFEFQAAIKVWRN